MLVMCSLIEIKIYKIVRDGRKECRLSREDRRTQPGAFVRATSEVEYIENSCTGSVKL